MNSLFLTMETKFSAQISEHTSKTNLKKSKAKENKDVLENLNRIDKYKSTDSLKRGWEGE